LEEEWEFYGDSKTVSEAYIKKKAGRTLIKYRHKLNKLIDQGKSKPMDVVKEYWDELVKTQGTPKARARSQLMRDIATGRGLKGSTVKAVEKKQIVKLVSICSPL
jgi:hypothetical protein